MGFWGWLIVVLVLGVLIWLILRGPAGLKLALIMVVVGIFLGAFLWEVFLDNTSPDLWPDKKPGAIIKDSKELPVPVSTTLTIASLPQTLSSTQALNIAESGEVIAYLYDDPKTPNVDLVLESPVKVGQLSVNGTILVVDEVNIDDGKYYVFTQVPFSLSVGMEIVVTATN